MKKNPLKSNKKKVTWSPEVEEKYLRSLLTDD